MRRTLDPSLRTVTWAVPADVLDAARATWGELGRPAALRRRTGERPLAWQPGQRSGEAEEENHPAGRGRR
eukprot:6880520-Lingulodinium_polyedra.AAC.1